MEKIFDCITNNVSDSDNDTNMLCIMAVINNMDILKILKTQSEFLE